MSTIVVIEGGGSTESAVRRYRVAAEWLFKNATGRTDIEAIFAGGRSQAAAVFKDRLSSTEDVVLLVDAEEVVAADTSVWEHLGGLSDGARIERPPEAGDGDAHLMAVVTESWVLAGSRRIDRNIEIHHRFLDEQSDVEVIDKARALSDAQAVFGSKHVKKRTLLEVEHVDHRRLRRKAVHAERFFDRLAASS